MMGAHERGPERKTAIRGEHELLLARDIFRVYNFNSLHSPDVCKMLELGEHRGAIRWS